MRCGPEKQLRSERQPCPDPFDPEVPCGNGNVEIDQWLRPLWHDTLRASQAIKWLMWGLWRSQEAHEALFELEMDALEAQRIAQETQDVLAYDIAEDCIVSASAFPSAALALPHPTCFRGHSYVHTSTHACISCRLCLCQGLQIICWASWLRLSAGGWRGRHLGNATGASSIICSNGAVCCSLPVATIVSHQLVIWNNAFQRNCEVTWHGMAPARWWHAQVK